MAEISLSKALSIYENLLPDEPERPTDEERMTHFKRYLNNPELGHKLDELAFELEDFSPFPRNGETMQQKYARIGRAIVCDYWDDFEMYFNQEWTL